VIEKMSDSPLQWWTGYKEAAIALFVFSNKRMEVNGMNKQTVIAASLALGLGIMLVAPAHAQLARTFSLKPDPKRVACLQKPGVTPSATVTVGQGALADDLTIIGSGIKPGLAFDLFTVQKSIFRAGGTPDPNFTDFGLAWYQTDLEANSRGQIFGTLHTILVNQIFGFDPEVSLPPTNTFHVGFWFNNPADAANCNFTGFTPFNGEHHAGPVAMISVPSANGLGPLCLSPNNSTHPATCNP
jgi:hypothetical protein